MTVSVQFYLEERPKHLDEEERPRKVNANLHKFQSDRSFHEDTLLRKSFLQWGMMHEVIAEYYPYHVWNSTCGRYRIVRIVETMSKEPRFNTLYLKDSGWDWANPCPKGTGRPRDYKTLNEALHAVEKFHRDRFNIKKEMTTNSRKVLSIAEVEGMHRLPEEVPPPGAKGNKKTKEFKKPTKVEKIEVGSIGFYVLQVLQTAGSKHPISLELIVKKIKKHFPERSKEKLTKNVYSLVMWHFPKKKGIFVQKTDAGFCLK